MSEKPNRKIWQVEIQEKLTEMTGVPVDLVHRPDLKPHIGEDILGEVVVLFNLQIS
jgi:predicted nucleotidyltransferase